MLIWDCLYFVYKYSYEILCLTPIVAFIPLDVTYSLPLARYRAPYKATITSQ